MHSFGNSGPPIFPTMTFSIPGSSLIGPLECSSGCSNRCPENPPLLVWGSTPTTIGQCPLAILARTLPEQGQPEHCASNRRCRSPRQHSRSGPTQDHNPFSRHWTVPIQSVLDQCVIHQVADLERDLFLIHSRSGSRPRNMRCSDAKRRQPECSLRPQYSGIPPQHAAAPLPLFHKARTRRTPPACHLPAARLAFSPHATAVETDEGLEARLTARIVVSAGLRSGGKLCWRQALLASFELASGFPSNCLPCNSLMTTLFTTTSFTC